MKRRPAADLAHEFVIPLPPVAHAPSVWIGLEGLLPRELVHVEFRVGERIALSLRGEVDAVHPLTAGEMLAAIAFYTGRAGTGFEYRPKPEDDGLPGRLMLWTTGHRRLDLQLQVDVI